MKNLVIILNDGETFSLAEGCVLVQMEDEALECMQDLGMRYKDIRDDAKHIIARF